MKGSRRDFIKTNAAAGALLGSISAPVLSAAQPQRRGIRWPEYECSRALALQQTADRLYHRRRLITKEQDDEKAEHRIVIQQAPFDSSLGMWRMCRDPNDAQLPQCAPNLRRRQRFALVAWPLTEGLLARLCQLCQTEKQPLTRTAAIRSGPPTLP